MKSNNPIVILISIVIILGFFNLILLPMESEGKEITKFDNGGGQNEYAIDLKGTAGYCTDSSTYFSVPIHKGLIQEASLEITCEQDTNGDALTDPSLDIGVDGDIEWAFEGRGYGSINHQTMFNSGMERKVVAVGNSLQNNLTKIYLPKGAVVSDASLNILGGDLKFGEIYIAVVTSDSEVWYIKSNGDRTFCTPEMVADIGSSTWPQSYGIGQGDFDNDGDNDIIANEGSWSSSTTGNFYLLKKTGANNSFANKKLIGTTGYYRNTDLAVGDFDHDDNMDFVTSEWNKNFYFFKGNGNNGFTGTQISSSFKGGNGYGKDAGDFNLDGNLDFVSGGSSAGSVYVFEGNGDGTFETETAVTTNTNTDNRVVIAGDYNNDGNPDIIMKSTSWWNAKNFMFIPGKGDLTFLEPRDTLIDESDWNMNGDGFDFNFDGKQDFVTYENSWPNSTVYIFWGRGNGMFESTPTTISHGMSSISCVATPPGEMLGGFDDLKIDVGENGIIDYDGYTGPFKTEEQFSFKDELNSLLASPPSNINSFTDDYGNTILEIPLKFTATAIGNVLLKDLSINYSYTAKVDKNPHNTNLVNELNDLIPKTGTGDFKVYFAISSKTPGKVRFSDLSIKFNEAPLVQNIPDLNIDEGSDNLQLIDLANFFDDTEEDPVDLEYKVYSNSKKSYVGISIYNDHWLHVNASKSPDWYGETRIIISAEDSANGITESNEFVITIDPVNDPPRVDRALLNVELKTNEVRKDLELDDPNQHYFYDVDSPELFFRAIVNSDPMGKYDDYLEYSIDNDTGILRLRAFNDYMNNIPVRIYCSDSKSVRTMDISKLGNIPTYQNFIVNITEYGMGKKITYPPVWKDIEDIELNEDEVKIDWLDLNNYTTDADGSADDLKYSVESVTNSAFVNIQIDSSKDGTRNLLSIIPEQDFDGDALVVLRAEDEEHNYALEEFKVTISSSPDKPVVEILSPEDNAMVTGFVTLSGRAIDPEHDISLIEIQIGTNPWTPVKNLIYWSYDWDSTKDVTSIDTIEIKVRAKDSKNLVSEPDVIQLTVNNKITDSDQDGVPESYDAFPNDPLNWADTDKDGTGDNTDPFPTDPSQWEDTDFDGYGDNPTGNSPDAFPLDPTQWTDSDNDGFGDNMNGNNPDHFPGDEKRHSEQEEQVEGSLFTAKNLIWLIPIIFLILTIFMIGFYIKKRKEALKDQ